MGRSKKYNTRARSKQAVSAYGAALGTLLGFIVLGRGRGLKIRRVEDKFAGKPRRQ
jgi:hypothetical protein